MNRLSKIITTAGLALVLVAVAACSGTKTPRAVTNSVGSAQLAAAPAQHGPNLHINYVQGVQHYTGGNYLIDFYLYNNTPYTWTLEPTQTTMEYFDNNGCRCWQLTNWWEAPPPQTVQPGQVVDMKKMHKALEDAWVSYSFTNANGGRHLVQINDAENGELYDPLYSYSNDWDPAKGWVEGVDVFKMYDQPGAPANSVGAFLSHPVTITIDGTSNPDGAAQALKYFADSDPKTRSFTPAPPPVPNPTWSQSDPVPGSATLINTTSAEAELTATSGTTNEETTSLSEEISWETELGILGLANQSIGASIEGGQEWKTSTEVANGAKLTVDPNQQGFFTKTNQVQNVTGDFVFSVSYGPPPQPGVNPNVLTYHINNATFSMPGLTHNNPGGLPVPGTAFTACTQHYQHFPPPATAEPGNACPTG